MTTITTIATRQWVERVRTGIVGEVLNLTASGGPGGAWAPSIADLSDGWYELSYVFPTAGRYHLTLTGSISLEVIERELDVLPVDQAIDLTEVKDGQLAFAEHVNQLIEVVERMVPNGIVPSGPSGPPGVAGEDGLSGRALLSGSGAPISSLGFANDLYLNVDTGDIWVRPGPPPGPQFLSEVLTAPGEVAIYGPTIIGKSPIQDLVGSRSVKDLRYGAVMDGVTDDRTPLLNAIAAAQTAGGGTVVVPAGTLAFTGVIEVPGGVNLWGGGCGNAVGQTTIFKCLDAAAQIKFGNAAASSRGGRSGNFVVDGNAVATTPFAVVRTNHRVFDAIDVRNSAAGGSGAVWLYHCNNCLFLALTIDGAAGDGLVIDTSANGNTFVMPRIRGSGTAAGTNLANLKFTSTQPTFFATYMPLGNLILNPLIEDNGGNLAAQVWYGAGVDNHIVGGTLSFGTATASAIVRTNGDNVVQASNPTRLHIVGVTLTGGAPWTTAFDLANNSTISLEGRTRIHNVEYLYHLRGANALVEVCSPLSLGVITNTLDPASTGVLAGQVRSEFPVRIIVLTVQTTSVKTVTANYTATLDDEVILCDAMAGAITITPPNAAAAATNGKEYTIKKIDGSANGVIFNPVSTQTVDGATTKTLGSQWAAIRPKCDQATSSWSLLSQMGTIT